MKSHRREYLKDENTHTRTEKNRTHTYINVAECRLLCFRQFYPALLCLCYIGRPSTQVLFKFTQTSVNTTYSPREVKVLNKTINSSNMTAEVVTWENKLPKCSSHTRTADREPFQSSQHKAQILHYYSSWMWSEDENRPSPKAHSGWRHSLLKGSCVRGRAKTGIPQNKHAKENVVLLLKVQYYTYNH